jgi:hypothetical protein
MSAHLKDGQVGSGVKLCRHAALNTQHLTEGVFVAVADLGAMHLQNE